MPHSMQGSRGQVRFRGKNSPRFRKEEYRLQQEAYLRTLAAKAQAEAKRAKEELERERQPLTRKLATKARGFVNRLFSRKTG